MVQVRHIWPALLIAAATARSSPGEQYWVRYDASSGLYPEQSGYQRHTLAGGAVRYFNQGSLVLDSRASIDIVDYYERLMGGHLDPNGPGETFIMRWRLKIDACNGLFDLSNGAFSDDRWGVAFGMGYDAIYSESEPGNSAHFAPDVFHDFEMRSSDMRHYGLFIDGQPALSGSFVYSVDASRIVWGDGVQGAASLSHWQSFEFGVVPEPGSSVAALVAGCLYGRPRSRGRRNRVGSRVGLFRGVRPAGQHYLPA